MTRYGLVVGVLLGLAVSAAETAGGLPTRGGRWQTRGNPPVVSQSDAAVEAARAWLPPPGEGGCWRAVVEAGPYAGKAGIRWAAAADGTGGYAGEVIGSETGGLALVDPAGKTLWRDEGMGWCAYTPVWIEGIVAEGRVRLQMLAADRTTLMAQSPWFPVAPDHASAAGPNLALFTAGNTAHFCLAERSATPLAEFTPDNPSALRVPAAGDPTWAVIGGGVWRWKDRSRQVLLSTRNVERTTAFLTAPAPAEGTWRCRIRLNQGTCGGGMLIHADRELQNGFLVWLGGTYGNGCLMLYRYPIQCLWAGPQGVWNWDTDYHIEAILKAGTLQARMLAADGTTVLAESPALPIAAGDAQRTGMTGFQTWHGTGEFSGFDGQETPAAPAAVAATAKALGDGWLAEAGQWVWGDDTHKTLRRQDRDGLGAARCEAIQGARGGFRCRAKALGAEAVSLRFQVSPDGSAGFECRLAADGLALRTVAGQVLWETKEARLADGTEVVLEGLVTTDRVKIRVSAADGRVLAESVERYVSDANNDRSGFLGLGCEGGPAEFWDWGWRGE